MASPQTAEEIKIFLKKYWEDGEQNSEKNKIKAEEEKCIYCNTDHRETVCDASLYQYEKNNE